MGTAMGLLYASAEEASDDSSSESASQLSDNNDQPSNTYYYKNGVLHREDGPAIEYTNGSEEWFIDGQLHREGDKPARIIYTKDRHHVIRKREEWYQRGRLYRHPSNGVPIVGYDGMAYWDAEMVRGFDPLEEDISSTD